jgi:phasin family protein
VAETRAKKTVAAVARKAIAPKAKAPAAPKAKTVRAAAQKTEAETIFSKPIEGLTEMTDTAKKAAAEAGEKATEMLKDVSARAKNLMSKGGEMTKDVMEFNKANLEAVVESGKIAAKGAQTAAQNAVELTKKNWEANTSHVKSLTGVRAPADFFQMQTEFARKQFDAAVAEMSKNTEFTLKLAGEVVAPIQNRYAVVVDQVKARMAA